MPPSQHPALVHCTFYAVFLKSEAVIGIVNVKHVSGVEPPSYLQQLNPQLYEEECRRVQSRFDEAVRLAEEAFTAELAKLLSSPHRAALGPGRWEAQNLPR